ncbi:HNH endonuclease [Bacillus toyonensis]|uniref:HNH endonuclease n=1 Tax=Bacillus toyonensis TaxID=155322 RepID=UPI000BF63932|nr:HNH endonuclease [Bacillus toyonensis]PGF00842.1 hypothetical protein COM61_22570 [Bacillus toyonensis]PHE46998.1 hypothetical protein COF71_13665 [Bacillus toyonensis]
MTFKLPVYYKNETHCYTEVDEDIFDEYRYKKLALSSGYAIHKRKFLHSHIMDTPMGKLTDHIDGNKMNNKRVNLRIVTKAENNRNVRDKGFYWHKYKEKWHARITVDYKVIHIGYYDTEKEASEAYKQANVKYFKEYSPYYLEQLSFDFGD